MSQPQLQALLAQLASQPVPDMNQSSNSNPSTTGAHITPYVPSPFDFPMFGDNNVLPPSSSDGLISFNPLETQWQHVEDVQRDVNAVDSSIQSIIDSLGMDASMLNSTHPDTSSSTIPPLDYSLNLPSSSSTSNPAFNLDMSNPANLPNTSDFDFDSELTTPTATFKAS